MLNDFINQAEGLHQARLREWTDQARMDAMRREAKAIRRLRRAVGHTLISLGERIADRPVRSQEAVDEAA
jgi:hypothetical protein